MFDLPPPDPSLEVTIASQGISKGLRQTDGPQLVVRGELAFGGVYLGLLAKNISSPVADLETQFALGYRARPGGFELNGAISYQRRFGDGSSPGRERFEFQFTASRRIGPVTPRFRAVFSPDDFGAVGSALYVEGGASLTVAPGASIGAALGRRERSGGSDYTSFNLGATYAPVRWIEADLRYYDTAESGFGVIYEPRLVGALRLRF